MLRPFLCLLLTFCCAVPAYAMDVNDKGDPGLSVSSTPGALPAPAKGDPGLAVAPNANPAIKKGDPGLTVTSIASDSTLCRALVKHTPNADVNAQPGTDARGKPIAPADVPGSAQMDFPKTTVIPLTLSLAKVLNLNTAQYPYNQLGPSTEVQVGTLTVTGDKVLYNGQPLSDTQQDKLAVLCMQPNK